MNKVNNPFTSVGTAVQGGNFIGRDSHVQKMKERLFDANFGNVAIVGIPKIGKSSLMQEVLFSRREELWNEKGFIVVWHTLKKMSGESKAEKRAIFLSLISSVYHFLKKKQKTELLELLNEYYEVIKDTSVVWTEFEQNILYFFEEIVYAKLRVIYCIDEFDYSKEVLGESEYQLLREISYRNSNKIAIVTTSRRSIYDIEHYSGGGSNFYGTFDYVYLKPFSTDEHRLQCNLLNISERDITTLYELHGGHPYISALVLRHYFENASIKDSISIVNQEILRYYKDLFYVLEKDDLADKVDKLYCGFLNDVTETQEDYILNCYGIFKKDGDEYIPYCSTFENILQQRYRENPFSLVWPAAETSIRKSITYAMREEYGDDKSQWVEEIKGFEGLNYDRYNKWIEQMNKEKNIFKERASSNIIDQLYPWDYIFFFEHFWTVSLKHIYKEDLLSWTDRLRFIASTVRNPIMHSRQNLLSPEELQDATLICAKIIEAVNKAGL